VTATVSENRGEGEGRLATAVFFLDSWLRRRQGVFEYSADPACMFRLQRATAEHYVELRDGTVVLPGNPILRLHVWNEHVRAMRADGSDFAWPRRINKGINRSLLLLHRHLQENGAAYRGLAAIHADMGFVTAARVGRLGRLSERFGFEWLPAAAPRPGRLHHLGENILLFLLIAAANPPAARLSILRSSRTSAYLSRRQLEQRYGAGAPWQEADVDG
jgi:hypothetical protein